MLLVRCVESRQLNRKTERKLLVNSSFVGHNNHWRTGKCWEYWHDTRSTCSKAINLYIWYMNIYNRPNVLIFLTLYFVLSIFISYRPIYKFVHHNINLFIMSIVWSGSLKCGNKWTNMYLVNSGHNLGVVWIILEIGQILKTGKIYYDVCIHVNAAHTRNQRGVKTASAVTLSPITIWHAQTNYEYDLMFRLNWMNNILWFFPDFQWQVLLQSALSLKAINSPYLLVSTP